jgi:hypothetical protein
VAINCTYCGREVPPGSSVCPACGQAVAAAPAPGFAPVNVGGPAAPGYVQESTPYTNAPYTNAPPPASSGGGALKIILIVVGVFVFLGLLVVGGIGYVGWRASKAIHAIADTDSKTGSFTLNTPNGKITAGSKTAISESDLGIAIYPGATRGEGSMNIKTPTGSLVTATYMTSDAPSQVVEFYKGKLGDKASTIDTGNATMISSADDDNNNKVMITVTSDNGKTKVTIMHSTKKS